MKQKQETPFACFKICLKHAFHDNTTADRNTFASDLFRFFVRQSSLEKEDLSLLSRDGTCLTFFPEGENERSGRQDPDCSDLAQDADFYILASSKCRRLDDVKTLREHLHAVLDIYCNIEQNNIKIFRGLDALPVSISIYDKYTHLLYGNDDFCNYLQIRDRNAAYGHSIEKISEDIGLKILSTRKPHNHLKLNDVVKYGKPVVDWEVEVFKADKPDAHILASNDMYPILDDKSNVIGAVEIARSRHEKIKQVQNTLGLTAEYTFDDIIGNSHAMLNAKKLAMTFANNSYNILIYGESGVGKELFAQSIHNYSDRRNKPFVSINCASVSPELIDSELFGYTSGAFTGASKGGQVGKFELADGGTLFLDEVAEMPLHFQTKLLRALETRKITRVGGSKNIPVDVRIIAATNCSLEKMIKDGLFREDLYYRLMVLNLEIPPLREHPEDIIPCALHFLERTVCKNHLTKKTLSDDAKKLLMEYYWPGNIRELRNVISRISIMSPTNEITRETLSASLQLAHYKLNDNLNKSPEMRINDKRNAIGYAYADLINEALTITHGNKSKAAELLQISRKTFYDMLDKYKPYFL